MDVHELIVTEGPRARVKKATVRSRYTSTGQMDVYSSRKCRRDVYSYFLLGTYVGTPPFKISYHTPRGIIHRCNLVGR